MKSVGGKVGMRRGNRGKEIGRWGGEGEWEEMNK